MEIGYEGLSMKLMTWNVNGLRAAVRKGFLEWLSHEDADIVCVQEIKAKTDQLDESLLTPHGMHSYWNSAQKLGYSGVAIFSKKKPLKVQQGIGLPVHDSEGRVLLAEYSDFTVLNCYFPNTQPDHARLPFKLMFCEKIIQLCESLKKSGKPLIICGDFNVAHQEIDLKNPKSNQNNAGFLPEERDWMTRFLELGYVDTFRYFVKEPGHYTWWSYRTGVRAKNIGWRIDYCVVTQNFQKQLQRAYHQPHILGSDHCPVVLEFVI